MLFNLGQAHRKLGHGSEALHFYSAYLREMPDGPNRAVAEKQVKELKAQNWKDPFDSRTAATETPAPPPSGVSQWGPPVTPPVTPPAPRLRVENSSSGSANAPTLLESQPASGPPLQRASTPLPRWLPAVGAVLTVAAVTGAIGYGLSASSRYDDLARTCGQTAAGCTAGQIDYVRTRDTRATMLWISGGVLAAATGVTAYFNVREAGLSSLWRF
jgi:hypothetical protein